ncbi:MAG: AbrB/MazE/SpoVT family DNA-binding domain-containing protein [Sphaerochaeta sp.]|jgi:antitoxin MazE|nr:AbrB/MazE/SpoVT family DNA-binding domain-containing protein [Sphaerochaeta sp.]
MKVTVKKWGNSLGLRIPAVFTQSLDLNDGSVVELSRNKNGIQIIPQKKSRQEQLNELLDQITPENMHRVDFFGMEVGKEEW